MTLSTTIIELDSDPAKNADLEDQLQVLCCESGLDDTIAFQFRLAITEAINNIIKHSYGEEPGHPIRATWRHGTDAAEIELRDWAPAPPPPYPPPRGPIPPPDALSSRGWYIIWEYTDAVRYARMDDGNVLTLTRLRGIR